MMSRRSLILASGVGGMSLIAHPTCQAITPGSQESLRAVFHMTAPRGWLCDCQRPIRLGDKTLLYYLHSQTNVGDGGWDVATTTDLVTFTDHRVAIPVEPGFPVWSGSAVVDVDGTAGYGRGAVIVLATQPTGGVRRYQEQYLYWSTDGISFTRRQTPVIMNPDGRSARSAEEIDNAEWFRDPKVVWDKERSEWVCVIGRRKYASVYVSKNLTEWTWTSNFDYLVPGAADLGGMECPDLFQMRADDGTSHWVLAASMDASGAGLPMTYAYWIGQWDGTRFQTDSLRPQWLDWGWDWYAAVTWPSSTEPETLRYAIAWMNNWKYAARDVPTDASDRYNGQMSVVRELRLRRQPGDWYSLLSQPVAALGDRAREVHDLGDRRVEGRTDLAWRGRAYEIETDISWDAATNVGLSVGGSADDRRHANIGVFSGKVYVDRGPCDQSLFSFLPYRQAEAPIDPAARSVHLRVLVDRQSIEVFVNAGHTVLSQQVYFRADDTYIRLYSYGGPALFSGMRIREFA